MDDVRVLRDLAERLADAEMACDAAFIESMLADDAVIMPPNIPAIEGRDACLEFIREVLGENAREFERRAIEYTTAELSVHGGIAVDRGTFVQTLVPFAAAAASAPTEVYEGQ
jgi:ketosteroid isomerase-like protein